MALPIQLGIIVSVYIGTRLWQKLRDRTPQQTHLKPHRVETLESVDEEEQRLQQQMTHDEHQLRVSTLGVASTVGAFWLYPPLGLANLALITYNSMPIIDAAARSLKQDRQIRSDSYSALVSLLCLGTGNLFAGAMHNAIFYLSCRSVEASKQQSRQQLREVFLKQPDDIWTLRDGVEIEIPLAEVQVGDSVVVHTGDLIPVDGVVQHGQALVDQQNLTGETQAVERNIGDTVLATGLVISGQLVVTSTHSGSDSRAHRLNELLQQSGQFKTQLQLRGEQWSDRISLPVIVSSAVAWPLFGSGMATALLFSAPANTVRSLLSLQTSSHMQWAARQGILIRDGRALEELLRVDIILFDKTGTLTEPQPRVHNIIPCGTLARDPLLAYAASAEQHLQHPIANALLQAAEDRNLLLPAARDSRYDLGMGVSVTIGSRRIHVGSSRFIQDITATAELPTVIQEAMRRANGHTFVLVALESQIQGAIELSPRLRADALPLINALRRRGRQQLGVVSGDHAAPTERIARQLGLDVVHASMLPRDKANLIRRLQAQGHRVCFVGDGLNDAIAMRQANVSVCPGGGAELIRNDAQVVLLDDRLMGLAEALDIAAQLHLRLAGSLGFWIGFGLFNVASVPLLQFGPLQSSLLYGAAFGLGLKHARQAEPVEHGAIVSQEQALQEITPTGTILHLPGPQPAN